MSDGEEKAGAKPEVGCESELINLHVSGFDGSVVDFKIKRNTKLKNLMQTYCDRQGLQMTSIRFFCGNNCWLCGDATPAELKLKDDDTIQVYQEISPPTADSDGIKVKTEASEDFINLIVTTPVDGTKLPYKIRKSAKLEKLMKQVCHHQNLPMTSIRFIYDGIRIGLDSTPEEYEMEDGDVIDVFWEQLAGQCLANCSQKTSVDTVDSQYYSSHCIN